METKRLKKSETEFLITNYNSQYFLIFKERITNLSLREVVEILWESEAIHLPQTYTHENGRRKK